MGTNIFARKKLTQKQKDELITLINEDRYEEIRQFFDSHERIHIGKCSCGWKFLFEKNPDCYTNSRESIDKFIGRDDVILETEYGERLSPSVFWTAYVDSHKDGKDCLSDRHEFGRCEEIIDGLMFTDSKNWL